MRRLPRAVLLALLCAMGPLARAQSAAPALPDLFSRVELLLSSRHAPMRVGICVRRLPDGEILYQRHADERYELASNTKLLTTAAALDTLGTDYGFVTRIYARGSVDYFGNLDGDLVINGSGDPSLTGKFRSGDLDDVVAGWIDSIRAKGIRSVMGNVVLSNDLRMAAAAAGDDESAGGDDEASDEDPDEALLVEITPAPRPGQRPTITVRPRGASLRIINNAVTVAGDARTLTVVRGKNDRVTVGGRIGTAAGTMTHLLASGDPALIAASLLRQGLPRAGVPVLGDVAMESGRSDKGTMLLAESRAELSDTLDLVNKRSHNPTAEEIFEVMGARSGEGDGRSGGRAVVADFLKRQGIDPVAFNVFDGSGLSHENRMTPEALSQLLVTMSKGPQAAVYKSSLARPGEDGTLRARLEGIERYARISAKTGHISGVNTLTGYLDTARGSYVFSLLTNSDRGRADNGLLDAIVMQIASSLAVADGSVGAGEGIPMPQLKAAASQKEIRKARHALKRSSRPSAPTKTTKATKAKKSSSGGHHRKRR